MSRFTSTQNHAHLIREMSNKSRSSSESSRHSQSPAPTISDFDPENEAMMSTRQLGNALPKLPQLRASAKKYRHSPRTEPDYAINTSAIGRAFPDFSQGSISHEDDSMSIEIGRGAKKDNSGTIGKLGRAREYPSNLNLDEDSLDFAAPINGNSEITGTPPLRQRQPVPKARDFSRGSGKNDPRSRRESGLRKEVVESLSPPAKIKDYGSGESRGSGAGRRTLAAIHARVGEEDDLSRISNDRPPTENLTARNTRFGNTKMQHAFAAEKALPTKFSSTKDLLNTFKSGNKQKLRTASITNKGTQQSFVLPDMSNLSELVSGVFEDGTPVFSRNAKSRFSKKAGQGRDHVDEIPIPDDEQAIFLSLKLLQDKVAIMEKSQAEAENVIAELKQKNRTLETSNAEKRKVSHRSDSALGTTDSDGREEVGAGRRKETIEKNRLESSVRSLQIQVDASNRKIATSETILRNITKERDSAVAQLGVAYVTIEQLKDENEDLKARFSQETNNVDYETKITRANNAHRKESIHGGKTGKTTIDDSIVEALSQDGRTAPPTRIRDHRGSLKEAGLKPTPRDAGPTSDLPLLQPKAAPSARGNATVTQIDDSLDSDESLREEPRQKDDAKAKVETKEVSSGRSKTVEAHDTTRDLTYLSFLDSTEVAKLRRTLEQERLEQKQRQAARHQTSEDAQPTQQTQTGVISQHATTVLPRKSSMKDLTSGSLTQHRECEPASDEARTEKNRRHSETSMLSNRSRRRGQNAENMTSAFIVPDITIRTPTVDAQAVPNLSEENQRIIDELATHNPQNCTVCKRQNSRCEQHNHEQAVKESVTITKPVPVSERIPKTEPYEDEPTIRPSQAPGLALATVLKSLEDEIAHLKIQLAKYQALYNGHDPALSKRKRKHVYEKMQGLTQAIDVKADQIYALYDVLEGQKQAGHDISEAQVEVTLQSIGVDPAGLSLRGGDNAAEGHEVQPERHPWDLSSDEEGNDLPWEGIESTVETTKSGFARSNRKRSAAA